MVSGGKFIVFLKSWPSRSNKCKGLWLFVKKIASFSEAFESHNAEREVNGLIPLINKYLPAALLDTRMHGSAMCMTAQLPL